MHAHPHNPTPKKDRRDRTRNQTQVRLSHHDYALLRRCMAMPNTLGVRADGVSRYLGALLQREFAILSSIAGNTPRPSTPSNPRPPREPFHGLPIARERS